MISYNEFSKLRFRDFCLNGNPAFREHRGFECAIGFSGYEGDVSGYFAWPVDRPDVVGEIFMSFRDEFKECPVEMVRHVLNAVKLPLCPRMQKEVILDVLGEPYNTEDCPNGVVALDFVHYGDDHSKYKIRCYVHCDSGLTGISIVRNDMLEAC